MKIICVGRNYANHAKELGNAVPSVPVLFIKPETALNTSSTFNIPKFSNEIHFELELVLKITKTGKDIPLENASEFYNQIALGIDFTARDIQSELKAKGLPWEKAKAFDGAAVVSDFVDFSALNNPQNIHFELFKNNEKAQNGFSKDMLFDFNNIIAHASQYFTLEKDDLIFTGTPQGVGKIESGDRLIGKLEETEKFHIKIQ